MLIIPNDQHPSFDISESVKLNERLNSGEGEPVKFIIFWSSRNTKNGQMWCPDCVEMEQKLIDILPNFPPQSLSGFHYVYVGQRDEWKSPNNPYRKSPWNVERIPTVVKVHSASGISINEQVSSPISRLVEQDAVDTSKLNSFLRV